MSASNPWDVSKLKHMNIEDEDDDEKPTPPLNAASIIDPYESERLIQKIREFSFQEIGSSEWFQQHAILEKINLQSHQNAITNSDEFIIEQLLLFNKIPILIYELLMIELWKDNIYPLIINELGSKNQMRIYFILYQEAILINFFEIIAYHKHIMEQYGESMLELIDYCARKLTILNSNYPFQHNFDSFLLKENENTENIKNITDKLNNSNPINDLNIHKNQIEYKICVSVISVIRLLIEYSDLLPLNIQSRITDIHDILILIIPLIENPPWTVRLNKKWLKYTNHNWKEVLPINLLKVTKIEGQIWIMFYYYLAKTNLRERYHINTFRKSQILRIRKYLNEVLLDQLPFLVDIQRYLDELTISEVNDNTNYNNSNNVFMFQQVSVIRENLIKNQNWKDISIEIINNVFTMTDRDDKDLRTIADVYSNDALDGFLDS